MGLIARICAIITVIGAGNWIASKLAEKDAISALGLEGPVMHAVLAVVGLSALYVLIAAFKTAKKD